MTSEETDVNEAQLSRILHFVVFSEGQPSCRSALVVGINPDKVGIVNLTVFLNGAYDGSAERDTFWAPDVGPDHQAKKAHTWHWPRECKGLHNA